MSILLPQEGGGGANGISPKPSWSENLKSCPTRKARSSNSPPMKQASKQGRGGVPQNKIKIERMWQMAKGETPRYMLVRNPPGLFVDRPGFEWDSTGAPAVACPDFQRSTRVFAGTPLLSSENKIASRALLRHLPYLYLPAVAHDAPSRTRWHPFSLVSLWAEQPSSSRA